MNGWIGFLAGVAFAVLLVTFLIVSMANADRALRRWSRTRTVYERHPDTRVTGHTQAMPDAELPARREFEGWDDGLPT